jgi:hypothetical protein
MWSKWSAPSDLDYWEHGRRSGIEFSCAACSEPVLVDRSEPYPGGKVYCQRCIEELTALKAAREQRAKGSAA